MKKRLAILVLLILAVTVALTACKQPDKTAVKTRWNTEETHVFRITLADYADSQHSSFKLYDATGAESSKGEYRKDKAFANEALKDEIVPVAVSGTYKLTIKPTSGSNTCLVTGEQVIYAQYNLEDSMLAEVKGWTNRVVSGADIPSDLNPANGIVLKSVTNTSVEFNEIGFAPISSSTEVEGFYIGKANRNVTEYKVSTEYNFSEKKPTAKVTLDGAESKTYELPSSTATERIDSNQLLIYIRCLDKKESSFQDSKTVSVFDPFTGESKTASFGYVYSDKMILTKGSEKLATTVNTVSVTVGNIPLMVQDNIPGTVKADELKGLSNLPAYRTVHFRAGYLSYEIAYADETNAPIWNSIWEALTPKPETQPEA